MGLILVSADGQASSSTFRRFSVTCEIQMVPDGASVKAPPDGIGNTGLMPMQKESGKQMGNHLGVIRMPRLIEMIGISRSSIYLRLNPKSNYYDPKFPRPRKLGRKAVAWSLSEVIEYLNGLKVISADGGAK